MDFHCISGDLLGRNESGEDYDNVNIFQSVLLYQFIVLNVKLKTNTTCKYCSLVEFGMNGNVP